MNRYYTRGGVTKEFSEMRGPNKIFGSFCKINEYFVWTPHLRKFYRNATSKHQNNAEYLTLPNKSFIVIK